MIISASRRTDIPCFYSDWFFNRLKEGFLYVRNPMNARQVSKILLDKNSIDCIVFWTKNPKPMLSRIHELENYPFYFQFTLTGYGNDIELTLPDIRTELIPTFINLSKRIGRQRVILRYDPIFLNERYTLEYHCKAFEEITSKLSGYTNCVVISFLDWYTKIDKNMRKQRIRIPKEEEIRYIAKQFGEIARKNHMKIVTCAEKFDLSDYGIGHSSCIDKELIESITGRSLSVKKDKNQRLECGCVASVDIGTYNTCLNGCTYCYANVSREIIERNYHGYDKESPILCSQVNEEDKITLRKLL